MKPYPFELLNHFTVPCTYVLLLMETWMFLLYGGRTTQIDAIYNNLRGVYQNEPFSQESIRIICCKKTTIIADKIDSCGLAGSLFRPIYMRFLPQLLANTGFAYICFTK
jgi:hypothetical protein